MLVEFERNSSNFLKKYFSPFFWIFCPGGGRCGRSEAVAALMGPSYFMSHNYNNDDDGDDNDDDNDDNDDDDNDGDEDRADKKIRWISN